MQSRENEVAGFGGEERGGNGFEVAHFADEDDVRILTKGGAKSSGERGSVDFNFALNDEPFFGTMQIFDRVFDGDDVLEPQRIDAVNHGGERGGLTGTGGSRNEHEATLLFANLVDGTGKIEFLDGANFGWNDAEDDADVAALLENVDADTAKSGDAVSHVELGSLFEFLLLAISHHAEGHGKHFLGGDARDVGDGLEHAVDAEIRMVADFQMQVGGFVFDGFAQEIINSDGHSGSPFRGADSSP